jgi:hypothetical protein
VKQRRDLAVALVQLFAMVVLAYNLAANVGLSGTISAAWTLSCAREGVSPLASRAAWAGFLTTLTTLRTVLDPLMLPVRVLFAIGVTPTYRKLLAWLQRTMPLPRENDAITRACALLVAWLAGGLLSAGLALLGVAAGSVVTRVPMRAALGGV